MNKKKIAISVAVAVFISMLFGAFTNCSSNSPDTESMSKSSSSTTPTSTTAPAVGGACAAEGASAYDFAASKPLFCNKAKVWQIVGAIATQQAYCQNGQACDSAPEADIVGVHCPAGYQASGCSPNCYDTGGIRVCQAQALGTGCLSMCQATTGAPCNGVNGVYAICQKLAD